MTYRTLFWLGMLAVIVQGCAETKQAPPMESDTASALSMGDLFRFDGVMRDPMDSTDHNVIRGVFYFHRKTGERIGGERLEAYLKEANKGKLIRVQRGLLDDDGTTYGYITSDGKTIIPTSYAYVSDVVDGCINVIEIDDYRKVRRGIFDRDGNVVVPLGRHERFHLMGEHRIAFVKNEKWGMLDSTGKVVVPPIYPYKWVKLGYRRAYPTMCFAEGLTACHDEKGQCVFLDPAGKVILRAPKGTVRLENFHEGLARFSVPFTKIYGENLNGYLSKSGEIVIPLKHVGARSFSEGLAAVSLKRSMSRLEEHNPVFTVPEEKRSCGYIDKTGKLVIGYQFDRAGSFTEGLARVQIDGKWGYIDKSGKIVIPPRFVWACDFKNGVAEVWPEEDEKIIFINMKGETLVTTAGNVCFF